MPYDEEEEEGGFASKRGKSSKKKIHAEIGKKFEEMLRLCEKLKDSEEEDDASDD